MRRAGVTRRIRVSLLCAALLLAACGGGRGESNTSTAAPVTATTQPTTTSEPTTTLPTTTTTLPTTTTTAREEATASLMATLDASTAVTSARVEGSIEMTGLDDSTTGLSEAVILFSSTFDAITGNSSLVMDMSSLMGAIDTDEDDPFADIAAGMFSEIEFRHVDDTAYVKFPFLTSMLGAETEWVSMPADEGDDFVSGFETVPTNPNDLISAFDEPGASIEVVGTETVNGVEAIHYKVTLDTEAMELSPEEQADLAESGILAAGVIPLDIWISEDGYMSRMVMEIDGSGIDAPPDEQFETMTLRYDVFDVNGVVTVEPPPSSEVTPMEGLEDAFGFDQ